MQQEPAGFGSRLLAVIIDGVVLSIPILLIGMLASVWLDPDEVNVHVDVFSGAGSLLYSMILPIVWQGQTVGKYAMGIRIVKTDGRKLGIGAMLMRVLVANILYGITLYILMITSLIMVLVRRDKRAVHDFLARTQVVKKSR